MKETILIIICRSYLDFYGVKVVGEEGVEVAISCSYTTVDPTLEQ